MTAVDSALARGQLRRETLARGLQAALSLAVFHSQELRDASVNVTALEDSLLTSLAAASHLRQRIGTFAARIGGEPR